MRVRPLRVQISYDVQVGSAIHLKELPFALDVLGDFRNDPAKSLPKFKERRFVDVDFENFDSVLENVRPNLTAGVENKLHEDPSTDKLKMD